MVVLDFSWPAPGDDDGNGGGGGGGGLVFVIFFFWVCSGCFVCPLGVFFFFFFFECFPCGTIMLYGGTSLKGL